MIPSHRLHLTLLAIAAVSVGILGAESGAAPIYDEHADSSKLIQAAITEAARSQKNIVLDFGANWCGDCHALDMQMHKPELASLIQRNYVVVHVDVGRFDKNRDIAEKYHVPIKHGIPALAILDSHGKLLYAQDQGQFADARGLDDESFKQFFARWIPRRAGGLPASR